MKVLNEIYKCNVCGNIVEVVHAGGGELVCCGQAMVLQKPGMTDGAAEKHVPVIEKIEGGYRVRVGSAEHPMLENHYIEWIELHTPSSVLRHNLKPGCEPEALFMTSEKVVCARAYCNLHGLWRG